MRRVTVLVALMAFATLALTSLTLAGGFNAQLTIEVFDWKGRKLLFKDNKPLVELEGIDKRYCHTCYFNITDPYYNETLMQLSVTIYWLGVKVYNGIITLNNSSQTIHKINVNATLITILGLNSNDKKLENCSIVFRHELSDNEIYAKCNDKISLPFGRYEVLDASYPLLDKNVDVEVLTSTFTISNTTSIVNVKLAVAESLSIYAFKADGTLLENAILTLKYIPVNLTIYSGSFNGYLQFSNLPYGRYFVEIRWKGTVLVKKEVIVSENNAVINLTTNVIPYVKLVVKDADGLPLIGFPLVIRGPGLDARVTTDLTGATLLSDVIPGVYTVEANVVGGTVSTIVTISKDNVEVRLPTRKFRVEITPAISKWSLPSGLEADLRVDGTTIASAITTEPASVLIVEVDKPVSVQALTTLIIRWNDTVIFEKSITPYSRSVNITLPFFDLKVRVYSRDGNFLPMARLKLIDSVSTRFIVTNSRGEAEIQHLYGYRVLLDVYWYNVKVGRFDIRPKEVEDILKVYVDVVRLRIRVINVLKQPITDAHITVILRGEGWSLKINGSSNIDGVAEFLIPAVGAPLVEITASKGRVSTTQSFTLEEDVEKLEIGVVLDLVLDLGSYQLTTLEVVVMTLGFVVTSVVALIVYRSIARKRAYSEIFAIYGTSHEYERRSFWATIKDRMKVLMGGEEGEEESEEELFEEY